VTFSRLRGGFFIAMKLLLLVLAVTLQWDPNTETDLTGYNLYRSDQSGLGYVRLNADLIAPTTYTDNTIAAGLTYYYVATAVNDSDLESGFSNEVSYTPICRGDPSGDNQRTVLDAVMISQHITGINVLAGHALEAADVNDDGTVTVLDVTLVHRYIAGIYAMDGCQ
jgi:hypothetical protein